MKRKPKRYMTNLDAKFVSLVYKAANRREFLVRKDDDGEETQLVQVPVLKWEQAPDSDTCTVTGIVYEPEIEDTQGDHMTAQEIEKAAYKYMRDSQGIDIRHDYHHADGCWLAESAIAKSDFELGGEQVRKGSWYMTVGIDNPDIAEQVRTGQLNGFSVGGVATIVAKENESTPEPDAPDERTMLQKIGQWLMQAGAKKTPDEAREPDKEKKPDSDKDKAPTDKGGDKKKENVMKADELVQALIDKGALETTTQTVTKADVTAIVNEAVAAALKPKDQESEKVNKSDDIRTIIREELAALKVNKSDEEPGPDEDEIEQEDVEKSDVVTMDEIVAVVKSAVREEMGRAKSRPTNGNGTSVNKGEKKKCVLDGIISE